MKDKDKKELHIFGGNASCWQVVEAIDSLAKKQGGYTWQPVAEADTPPIIVPDDVKRLFERIDLEPVAELLATRQADWKVIVPFLQRLLPPTSKNNRAMLLDMLCVTYAANMGVPIPYIAFG